jgi:glycerophosphoryl diester phosphodiesterase
LLNIEPKFYGHDPVLVPQVIDAVRAYGMEDQVVIVALAMTAVRQAREFAPEIPVGFVAGAVAGDLSRLQVDFLAISRSVATDRLLRNARRRELAVHVWTLNRADSIIAEATRGVEGIITDEPFLAARIRDELAALTPPERLLLRLGRILFEIEDERASPRP